MIRFPWSKPELKPPESKPFNAESFVAALDANQRWALRQALARDGRFYGDNGTIHQTSAVNVETRNGEVVAVWFRCSMLPFTQREVDRERAVSMRASHSEGLPPINGIEFGPQHG